MQDTRCRKAGEEQLLILGWIWPTPHGLTRDRKGLQTPEKGWTYLLACKVLLTSARLLAIWSSGVAFSWNIPSCESTFSGNASL